ncbi:MAG: hypothetical protein LBI06_01660 [Treponema sp.]|jgi:hypothetical protein|nr:hypothetical protein [Treponema sp.]
MPESSQKIGEANFKAAVFQEYFGTKHFTYMQEVDRIDFVITDKAERHIIWAEAKKDDASPVEMFVQLILTIGKGRIFDRYNPPPFLCVFDYQKIAFLQYHEVNEIFYQNDFNWNVTPSDHKTKEFKQIKDIVENAIEEKKLLFSFDNDKQILKEFIKNNFVFTLELFPELFTRVQIDKNNFIPTYNRWLETVKPSIAIDWDIAKKGGIIDGDFYLADLLSIENVSLKERLLILLQNSYYKFAKGQDEYGISLYGEIQFKDSQKAYKEFWSKYKRPPAEIYWNYIIERRDLLVPQDIRERKGSFFTPQIWVQKSQEYLAKVLGEDWQDEYYVWDCAAGTGNLLVGLTNKYNLWASTLDNQDVGVMRDRIKNGANLLETHVFQFDFLNDEFDKLPEGLREIINDPEKRKKLIVYINPPYAEDASKGTENKGGVAINRIHDKYALALQKANHELFAQFLARIYFEIPECIIAEFSKLKLLTAPNFRYFRVNSFKAKLKKCFVVHADTFDNVDGKFPIGFKIWDTGVKRVFRKIKADVMEYNGSVAQKKNYCACDDVLSLNHWIKNFDGTQKSKIGVLNYRGTDFGNSNMVFIALEGNSSKDRTHLHIDENNLYEACIYCTVRHVIAPDWLNDRDQFLFPNDNYKQDRTFKSDCLIYMLFHGQNRVSSKHGTNHWIPFAAQEVGAQDNFKSNFMSDYLKGKKFSKEADNVVKSGKELWKYYHSKISGHNKAVINASFYDIREFFQGRSKTKGTMNTKSNDEQYNTLIKNLRQNLSVLAERIQPKVYEYGFLAE